MHYEFFIQQLKDSISVGDEIALFADGDDCYQSGRFIVASLDDDPETGGTAVTLVGKGQAEGVIQVVVI